MIALSNRLHTFARPEIKERMIEFFTSILGCELLVISDAKSMPTTIVVFVFPNGASLSVEFTADALDAEQARHGAWFELKTDDAAALKKKVLELGLPRVSYSGNGYFYFQAPGGQVLRIASTSERCEVECHSFSVLRLLRVIVVTPSSCYPHPPPAR